MQLPENFGRDPVDRIIAATAHADGAPLVTRDRRLRASRLIETVWWDTIQPMSDEAKPSNFIRDIILEHNRTGRFGGKVITRFPPEPNGYLHIGHAKAISIDFGMAQEFGGRCNLRFDDTNPTKESQEYVDAITRDVRWLGFDWGAHLYHASDYFEQLYQWAEQLIQAGKAYVDDLTGDQIREYRGTLTEPGRPSPFRDRPVEENLDLFRRMRAGEFADGRQDAAREDRHGRARTSTCATRSCTGSARPPTSARATRGASIRCTTGRTASRTRSRA